ncbi:MAG TPA: YfcE family phosphodiesterase [Gemmatimonadaceae bacterium]|nr:YfcE family phosphodiesterase [Gemmatimonadaceae bacterium]
MRVGIIADTHDRIPATTEFLRQMAEGGVSMVLHAGDHCSPFSLSPFLDTGITLAGVFGRNDGDPQGLRAKAQQGFGVELYESPHSLDIAGKRILLVHDLGEVTERSIESHAVVVHGCSHQQSMRVRDGVLVVNPGEACGWVYGTPTAAILDLESLAVEHITLQGVEWKS